MSASTRRTDEGGAGSGRRRRTRLAPSPTGALHLGNLRSFVITWALARRRGWRVLMRVEDLDTPRTKAGAADAALDLLAWVGLDWDEGPVWQAHDLSAYEAAMERLARSGRAYPCTLTRREIEAAASAPHGADEPGGGVYPRELRPAASERPRSFGGGSGENWRFACPDGETVIDDRVAGRVALRPSESAGDFVVWTKRGQPSYQLAVTVDDARQGVTDVVRGDDLLDSAGRQLALYRALGVREPGAFWHLPLVVGEDGRRLAKRHGDTRLGRYRAEGVRAERVVGLIAWLSGVAGAPREMSLGEFAEVFSLDTLPRGAVTFTAEHEAWLASGRSTTGGGRAP